jgi:hypothetical protein
LGTNVLRFNTAVSRQRSTVIITWFRDEAGDTGSENNIF